MSNYTEYVFCPHCGGITAPGTCVNCGMQTAEKQVQTDTDSVSDMQEQPANHQMSQTDTQSQFMYGQQSQYGASAQSMYGQPVQMNNTQQMYGGNQQYYNTYIEPEKPKKKSRWWIWLLIITAVIFLGLIVTIVAVFAAILVPLFMVNESTSPVTVNTQPQVAVVEVSEEEESNIREEESDTSLDGYDSSGAFDLEVYPRSFGRFDLSYMDLEATFNDAEIYYTDSTDGSNDIFLEEGYASTFGSNHDNHNLDEFTGEYYEPFVDCIDESYDYGMTRHYMEFYDYDNNVYVNAYIAYYELTGDVIPNQDALNDEIFLMTAQDLLAQLEGYTDYGYYTTGEVFILVDSFVTYNDSEKMSILLDVNISEDGSSLTESYIYGINIDLVNGEIIHNSTILNVDSEFAAMFRERCCTQNGTDIDGLNYMDDDQLAGFLSDDSTNIVFYSPYGLEVGYAYELSDGLKGWMTITMADYEEYLQ